MVRQEDGSVKTRIDDFGTTSENLTGRAGLTLISRYLDSTGIITILAKRFSFLKKNAKGTPLVSVFHQIISFFFDGTDFHMTRFDQLKNDPGYAGAIETEREDMISSHTAKRFFAAFSEVRVWLFRKVLKRLFIWRLKLEKPEIVKIGIDTMVMDNNDANQREGVEPTYKKVKGFQPLQVFWGRYLIDGVFRNGKAHSNHGNHVSRVILDLVKTIRSSYRKEIPIILLADTGFYDQQLFTLCEKLKIGFIVGGKMYQDIKIYVEELPDEAFYEFSKGKNAWIYCDFANKRKSWQRFWRTIYFKPVSDDTGQFIFEYARPETVIYTNLGMSNTITNSILEIHGNGETDISAQAIINSYHFRATDELVNRGFKDFGTEHLPFKSFTANTAFYYMMAISFFLFESFKADMKSETVPITWYATSFRRKVLDFAAKIVYSARRVVLKITESVNRSLDFARLWQRSGSATDILIASG